MKLRKSLERGHLNFGWLDTYHTFSFGEYYDPQHMGFRKLRVINEDRVAANQGFGTHPHNNMEIITYVLSGELSHKDSMGNGSTIYPGDVQRMSAGTGVTHSEFNHSSHEVHLLQIWILPAIQNLTPSYEQKCFLEEEKKNRLCLVASQDARAGSVKIHQDLDLYASILDEGHDLEFLLKPQRAAWIQVVSGKLEINGVVAQAGDGISTENETNLKISAKEKSEFLLFDLV